MLFETNINPPLLRCMMIIETWGLIRVFRRHVSPVAYVVNIDLGSHVRKPFGHVIGKFLSVVPMGGLNKSWSTIVLLLALVVLSTFRVNNANLFRHRVRKALPQTPKTTRKAAMHLVRVARRRHRESLLSLKT